jgi:hypothetical protein
VLAGDAFLDAALTGDEGLSMDLVYMAADQYHQCIILARCGGLSPSRCPSSCCCNMHLPEWRLHWREMKE